MLKRNGSKGTARVSKQRYTQRLNDIANADVEFIQNVEENTNFMMPTRRGGKSKSRDKTKHKHAPTILSQVKKYGADGSQKYGHPYVRTDEGVTDEQKNYLARRTEYTHDHMNPPTKSEQNLGRLPKLRKSLKNLQQQAVVQNLPTDLKEKDLDSVKQNLIVASASKLPARSNLDLKLKEQRHPSVDSEIDKPISEKRLRVSRPFTVASQNNSRLVAKQIKENAGSRGFLLNEDSEEIEPGLDVEARLGRDSDEVQVKGNSEHEMLMVESTDKQTTTQLQSFQNTHMASQNHFKTQPRPQIDQTQVASNSANDQKRIANLVNSENKRLWKLYDNTLVEKSMISKRERELVYGREHSRFDKKASGKQNGLNKSDSEKRVGQFIEAVKNHTIYRRDNFVRNFANQTKQSFDPYLKFKIEAKKDPFKTRPLSSAVSRANAMYPSRDTVRRANQTDGIPKAATSFNTNRNMLRPGQPRPLSSNFNNILLIRRDASGLPQGKQGMSADRLANAKLVETNRLNDSAVLSGKIGSKRTTRAGTNTQQNILSSFGCNQSDSTVNKPMALQHQRMLSYQLNNLHQAKQHTANKYRSRQRPVSSVPHAGKLQNLTSNAERQTQVDEHNQALSNEQTGDQFGDTNQIFDPSVMNLSQPLTGTGGPHTYKQLSDADMQMGVQSDDQATTPGDLNQTAYFNPKLSQPQSRPLTSPFTQTQLNTQPTRASNEFKSSQNLIQQLRIKSVRQSKVRIVQDPSVQGQYDIVTDGREKEDEIQFANSPLSKSKLMLFPKDRVVSNATNLHRATDSQQTGPLLLQSNLSSEQTTNFGDSSQRKAVNSFPEMHCKQLSIDALMNYEIIEHMQEFLVYSQTRCPIFIFDPSDCAPSRATLIFSRFKECIEIGELEQASSMINLGMKQKQFLPAFKMNVGVTYILSGRYMEAIQTFRMLAQSYPQSPSIHSNLLFAYLCDGWVENVKEFQSHTLFNQIQSPLSLQTQSILELIKYAFTNPDLIKFGKKTRSKSETKFSSTRVLSTKELNFARALNNDFQEASDLMEADEVEEENSESDFQQDPQAVVNLDYFKKNRRIKDFTRREKLDPMNHLLRKKMREARHPELVRPKTAELRPKTLSPNRQDAFSGLPNYWEHYQDMLEEYHRKDSNRQAQEKAYFEKVLDRIHRLCKDEENFQTGIKTKIEKSLPMRAKTVSTLKTFSKKRSTIGSIQSSLGLQSAEEKVRQEGDVNRILQQVKKVEEEKVKQIAEQGQMLDQIFQQLVSQRTTYVSSTASDPIDSSYLELIDGLGKFHERYNVRAFVDKYIQLQRDIVQSELNLELEEQKGKKWAAANMSPEQLFDKKELTQRFIDAYPVFEETVDRAKTFLLDVLFNKQESEIVPFKQMFEEMAYFAEDRKLKMTMDTERFNVESSFIKIMRELISVQQDLAQRIISTKNLAQVEQLKEKSELNDAYIRLLSEQKELSGRNAETVLLKNLEISKGKHAERAELALKVEAPFVNKDDETINPVAPEKQEYYRELYTRGWEKFTYRELPAAEKLLVQQKVSEEADQALAKARVKTQQRIIDNIKAKRKIGDEKTLEKIVQLEQRLEELKKHVKTVKSQEYRQTAFELAKQLEMKENQAIAHHDMQEYQIGLINAKLNLDAIEIKNRLPQNNTEDINLWEETAALKVVKKKIESITDTINNPQLLFEADKEKHRPMLEKWNNATRDILNRAKTGKSIKHLSNTLSDSLKDTIQQDEKQRHWQVRPKIGHELTNTQIGLIDTNIKQWNQISTDEIMAMDSLLAKNCRFFSIFDKSTRLAMYEHCQVNRYEGEEREIERDVEETEQIQVLLRGNIHIVQVNDDLDIRLRLASLRAGEVFGDQSIQRKIQDPLKILSKERKTAVTNSNETITISIQKEDFMGALFSEMQQELFYKIILLQNTNFFEELSPYSLTIIASNVEVREVKYGEVLVQQGQVPDAMYILAYGQCKTMYQYVEQKSTRVSKYANKCLKSDLPKPVHTGMTNYQSLGYKNRRTDSNEPQPDKVDANQKTSGSEAKTKAGQADKEAYKPKMSEQQQQRLESMDCAPAKRAFYHTILGENKKTMTIRFQNHLVYEKLKAGQFFGMRSLLDPLICKKHVLELRQMFCKKLDIDLDSLWKELVKQQQLSLDQVSLLKVKRKEANKQATKFCNKCFEQEIEHCTCLLNKLDPKQKQLAEDERDIKLQQEKKGIESSFYEEFNDSHDYDISMQQSFESKQSQKQTRAKNEDIKNLALTQKRTHMQADKAYREQRDLVREQIEELTKFEEQSSCQSVQDVQVKKGDHKQRLQKRVENEFSNRLYSQLMKAQASIVVTSATAKLLVIKKEDKGLLNEYLRVCLDRVILETNFADLDRPERNHVDVQTAVQMSRGWTTFKEKFMHQIMKESKMEKKTNKLLDD